jgi:glycerol-3-phosphate dehydrogenase (NAD(P)+)
VLWGRDPAKTAAIHQARENKQYLPGCSLPDGLNATGDLEAAVRHGGSIVVATPSHALRPTLRAVKTWLQDGQGIACACKGFEPGTGLLAHEVMAGEVGRYHPIAVISGPTFAKEIGRGMPTAVTVASDDLRFAEDVAHRLNGGGFRAFTATDVVGVEIGGAVKNVIAIACGISDGLGFGANARSSLICRGLAEIRRLGEKFGARAETLMGLAGLGDLVLTCTDNQSRNRRFGLLLGQGKSKEEALVEIEQVVEGVKAAPEARRLARKFAIDMPLTETVCAILEGAITPAEGAAQLAARPVRLETE